MDGMLHPGFSRAASGEPTPPFGILYAEDFDDPPEVVTPEPQAETAPAPVAQADIDRACAEAVERARLGWEAMQLRQRTDALASIASAIGAARAEADREAAAIAEGTVGAMLSMLSGALPRFCRSHGPAEARALVQHLLPTLQRETRVVIRVHPALAPVLAEDLALLDDDLLAAVTITPTALPAGDVKVTWADGSLTRDTNKVLAAMQNALAQLGLLDPMNPATERRMALAD